MATLDQIDQTKPVFIEPAQHDHNAYCTVVPVTSVEQITLTDSEAASFFFWVENHWKPDFERDLQGMCTDKVHGDLLTTWLPLVTFREDLCQRGIPREESKTVADLLDKLRAMTRQWRDHGVDTVYISGCDIRSKRPSVLDGRIDDTWQRKC